jgi:KDO2-lipid IV(A) lauroyltransferase
METLLYLAGRALVTLVQALPLPWVARLGRLGGAVAWTLDGRHRRVAIENLTHAFGGELSPATIRSFARENFRRLGENYAGAIRTAAMSAGEVRAVLSVAGSDKILRRLGPQPGSCVIAIGHFGNFELYARANQEASQLQFATTYRALRQPALNRLMQELRERSGCLFFERRTESGALKEALTRRPVMVGFLADQHAGDRGLRLPFLGRDCSTTAAPAVFALRYGLPVFTAICYRVGLARWRIEVGDEILTQESGHPRSVEAISLDINRAFELAVRRDPANWFWVHRRWKPGKYRGAVSPPSDAGPPVTAPPPP